ncbi:bifunctional tetrahydrofolate synthase/dihydrofolate synthase [Thiomicrorhabdus sp. 6S3-12]|uniref:bifunctional tetrahydrofolate synthase/dihydrofolate synthase n=1 Tax=Thiomicrorhabdus sp. 6S3-12 TaxID=2819681 RepID=UPI001AAD22B6|nr:bifunctional tetrahydrofolate synthase/dihydrofolate synthase [Thiomicrorhabdus sp. 6S3-12]MBO1923500.1 bifunctional tetrahydrofolate synthase/dihydrofolate synthase [Thiomicrorhabdus sp. 6S3-12]
MSVTAKPDAASSLESWIDWLLHLHAQEIDLGLERVRQVGAKMSILQPAPKGISVAGTNGKGSSVALLSSILRQAGYRVGAYTSPHIQAFNERIQIDGVAVDSQTIVEAFDLIERSRGQIKLTYFEFSTLAALQIFKQAALDVVVLEVGLGGRLDAVNIVDADAALITAIDVDHIDWLGDDRGQIAIEKAGITRSGRLAVCSDPNPPQTLADYCAEHRVNLLQLGRDFHYRVDEEGGWSLLWDSSAQTDTYPRPALKGDFQIQNAAGVLALLQQMGRSGDLTVSADAIKRGLQNATHPGRLQSVEFHHNGRFYHWLIDVAHNPQSSEVLADYLAKQELSGLKAVFSVLDDKDASPMVQRISPYVDQWYTADLQIPRSSSEKKLQTLLQDNHVKASCIHVYDSIEKSVQACLSQSGSDTRPETPDLLVWGSFFTVAQVYQALKALAIELGN